MLPKEMIERLKNENFDIQRREVLIYLNNRHPQGKLLHILGHKELTARLAIRVFLEKIDNAIHQTEVGVNSAFFNGNVQEYRIAPGAIVQYKLDDILSEIPAFVEEVSPYFEIASSVENMPSEFIPDLRDIERVDLNSLRNRVSEIDLKLCEISIATPHLYEVYYDKAINELT